MTTLVHQCPHCLTEKISFGIVGQSYGPAGEPNSFRNFFHLTCPECSMPVAAEVGNGTGTPLHEARNFPLSLSQMGWQVEAVWPEVPKPKVPEHVPDAVAKAFLSAERNFLMQHMEEAAAGSYGRALDVGTKLYAPDLAGITLYNRIKKLAEQHRITSELAAWAHAIRLIRNDALHDIESVSRDELVAIRGFTETVLTYLFTLPGMLAERQALTREKPAVDSKP